MAELSFGSRCGPREFSGTSPIKFRGLMVDVTRLYTQYHPLHPTRPSKMFNLSENSRLRGSGHLILNVFRAFNIIGLLAVATASWVLIVMSGLTGNFFFFEAVSHAFTSATAALLICSELNLFKRYFATRWPVLSPYHGLTWLGIAMVVMGCHILGNLNRRSVTSKNMGPHLWRLVLAAGILSITFGFFNIVSSLVFRDSDNGITARNIRSDGAIATSSTKNSFTDAYSTRSNSVRNEKSFRRLTQKIAPWAASGKLKISKPIRVTDDDVEAKGHDDQHSNPYPEDRSSPIMPDVARPPTALHPINTRFTSYSEASHMNRF
ncbi:hypothetical protein VDGE_06769 [Verticillium dahliae]|uniref:DUF7598 domain-containing protein n=1 Tax=Verticillium dahliae TaxID=27337 RepID=A0A444S7U3_VERDA|nr:hypothetical protein VDGE_06769 [Verticillium dahliae]